MTTREPDEQAGQESSGDSGDSGISGNNRPLLSDLFWRDEILQMMYWYQGEGFGTSVTARDLRTFLTGEEDAITGHLERMVADGYLQRVGAAPDLRYSFTEYGAKEGARRFADEFSDITKQGHGDCPPDCPICKDLPPEDCVHCRSTEGQVYSSAN